MLTVKAIITKYEDSYEVNCPDDSLEYMLLGAGKSAREAARNFLIDYEYVKRVLRHINFPFTEAHFEFVGDDADTLPAYIIHYDHLVSEALYENWFNSLSKKRQAKLKKELGISDPYPVPAVEKGWEVAFA